MCFRKRMISRSQRRTNTRKTNRLLPNRRRPRRPRAENPANRADGDGAVDGADAGGDAPTKVRRRWPAWKTVIPRSSQSCLRRSGTLADHCPRTRRSPQAQSQRRSRPSPPRPSNRAGDRLYASRPLSQARCWNRCPARHPRRQQLANGPHPKNQKPRRHPRRARPAGGRSDWLVAATASHPSEPHLLQGLEGSNAQPLA
jgi:hypothetical protein